VVQQAAASAEESAALSVEMSTQAEKLESVVDRLGALVGGRRRGSSAAVPKTERGGGPAASVPKFRSASSGKAAGRKATAPRSPSPRPQEVIPLDEADFKEF
jgi:hypothetical protein